MAPPGRPAEQGPWSAWERAGQPDHESGGSPGAQEPGSATEPDAGPSPGPVAAGEDE
jgi:hypothetical protein